MRMTPPIAWEHVIDQFSPVRLKVLPTSDSAAGGAVLADVSDWYDQPEVSV